MYANISSTIPSFIHIYHSFTTTYYLLTGQALSILNSEKRPRESKTLQRLPHVQPVFSEPSSLYQACRIC